MDDFHSFGFEPTVPKQQSDNESSSCSESVSEITEEEEEENSEEEEEEEEKRDEPKKFEVSEEVGNIASLIAMNQTCLDLIERLIKKVEYLLGNNREEQKRIKRIFGSRRSNNRTLTPIYRAAFFPPYFKDTHNLIPIINEESRQIRSICTVNPLLRQGRYWTTEELNILKKSVVAQIVEIKNRDVIGRRDFLRDKILHYNAQYTIEQLNNWKTELAAVIRRLNFLYSLREDQILEAASYDNVDWAMISVKEFKGVRSPLQLKMKWMLEQAPHWNKAPWTEEEDEALISSGRIIWQNWDFVSSKLNTKRTAFMCFERFHFLNKKSRAKKPWTTREDERLLTLVDRFTVENSISWKKISAYMPDRNRFQCEVHYNRTLSPNITRGRWTDEEDMLLIACVNKYGPHDWARISKSVPGRTDVQCRERWVDNLDYKRSRKPWSKEEDEAVLVGVKVFGRSSFSSIAKLIPGRNTSAVKQRFRTLLRWKIIEARNKANPGSAPASFGHSVSTTKLNPDGALQRFSQLLELSKKAGINQHGFSLARRLGYGNYVVSDGNQGADYSIVKQQLISNFGKWFVSKNGRWVRLRKNPNEFGEEELISVMNGLPEDKRKVLEQFLAEREERQTRAKKQPLPEDEQILQDVEQSERVLKLMDTVLIVEQKDIDAAKKSHASKSGCFLKLPFDNVPGGKDRNKSNNGQKLAVDLNSMVHDLAPKRYSIADRVTDEVAYKINQLLMKDRRECILNSMCEMVSNEMEREVQSKLKKLPRAILNVRVLNYLQSMMTKDIPRQERGTGEFEDTASTSSTPSPMNDSQSVLSRTLKNLVIPSSSNCNMLLHYKSIIRTMLADKAKHLFPILNDKFQPCRSIDEENAFMDIQLSDEVTADPSYNSLKERMFRLFLLPMLLKRSFESESIRKERIAIREAQNRLKEMQQMKLNEIEVAGQECSPFTKVNNGEFLAEPNTTLPFRVFNPQIKKQASVDIPEVPQPKKRPRIKISSRSDSSLLSMTTELSDRQSQISSTSQQADDNPINTEQASSSDPTLHACQPKKGRHTSPSKKIGQAVSVRDFILMNSNYDKAES